jgi:hypothetical protein
MVRVTSLTGSRGVLLTAKQLNMCLEASAFPKGERGLRTLTVLAEECELQCASGRGCVTEVR